jgi:hypothetical protein
MLRLRRNVQGFIVLLLILNAAACSLNRRVQIAQINNRLSAAGVQMKDFVQGQYDHKLMPVDEYEEWKSTLGKIARIGGAVTDALIAGNDDVAKVQVDALLDLIDDLEQKRVIKLNPNQQAIAYVILGSIRTTVDILFLTVMT